MAIDFAKGIATQVVSRGLQKVAGNLPGLLGINKGKVGFDSSDTANLERKENSTPNLFQFPLDVAGDPGIGNHGHYIIFFINEQQKSKLSFSDPLTGEEGKDNLVKEKARRFIPDYVKKIIGRAKADEYEIQLNTESDDTVLSVGSNVGLPDVDNNTTSSYTPNNNNSTNTSQKQPDKTENEKEGGQIVRIKRPATKRLDTAIAMYMPNQVQVDYKADYQTPEISGLASAAAGIFQGMSAGDKFSGAFKKAMGQVGDDFKKRAILKGLEAVDALGITGAREAVEISTGEVIADRLEMAFKNVGRRVFNYTFRMIPKNSAEAEEIRKIVFAFKANMLPEMIKGRDRDTMNVPNTFNIQYMYKGKENDYIHRVSECFLENVQVTYGGDRYKTFEPHADDGAPPVETQITLAFKEIEIITRERVFEGY